MKNLTLKITQGTWLVYDLISITGLFPFLVRKYSEQFDMRYCNINWSSTGFASTQTVVFRIQVKQYFYMMTWSNGNIFLVTGPLWEKFTGYQWIPLTKNGDAELWCFLRLNKRLSKQSWREWFKTPLCSLWGHCNKIGNGIEDNFS